DTIYQYPYFGRVLDEYIVYSILENIKMRKSILVHYQSVKSEQKQVVMNEESSNISFIPLQIVFDYMYARWYVIGAEANQDENEPLKRLRIDFISKIEHGEKVNDSNWARLSDKAKKELEKAWCITY